MPRKLPFLHIRRKNMTKEHSQIAKNFFGEFSLTLVLTFPKGRYSEAFNEW